MKTVCIYHSVDLDGWMSAGIVRYWQEWQPKELKDRYYQNGSYPFDYIGYNYGQPIPDLSQYDRVIMCDICFPLTEMQKLWDGLKTNLIWIDHHISAMVEILGSENPESNNIIEGIRNSKFSACELTWMYFFKDKQMPEIVRRLGRYDCFGHKGTDEEKQILEFQYGARGVLKNMDDCFAVLSMSSDEQFAMNDSIYFEGVGVYKYLCTEAQQTFKNRFTIDINGYKFACINKERFNPVNFGIDYHNYRADDIYFYDGCVCFHYANGKWNFSIYNDNGQVDCSVIAKSLGGGGHKGASGFVVEDINDFLTKHRN